MTKSELLLEQSMLRATEFRLTFFKGDMRYLVKLENSHTTLFVQIFEN